MSTEENGFKVLRKEGNLPNSLCDEDNLTLMPQPDTDGTQQNHTPILLISWDTMVSFY